MKHLTIGLLFGFLLATAIAVRSEGITLPQPTYDQLVNALAAQAQVIRDLTADNDKLRAQCK